MNFTEILTNSFDDDAELTSETDQGGIIIPKQTCEHIQYVDLISQISSILTKHRCIDCKNTSENWLCLSCGKIHCSRYVNNHGEEHWLFTLLTDGDEGIGHCLTISLQDLSVWCYLCKSYIKNTRLNTLISNIEMKKFGCEENSNEDLVNQIEYLLSRKQTVNPSTILAIQNLNLLKQLKQTDLLSHCYTIKLRSASIDELVRVHSSDYVNLIVSLEKTHEQIVDNRFQLEYDETTFTNARISAGTTIDAIENVLEKHDNGFILSTSPGHRAIRDHGNGTSIYNNIALAISSILNEKIQLNDTNNRVHLQGATPFEDAICHMINVLTPSPKLFERPLIIDDETNQKLQVERIMIIDLTSEHGCGLQSIYYESNQVFYVSIHNDNHQHRTNIEDYGKNQGLGYTMNIPLISIEQLTDDDYMKLLNELILPICHCYQPELIILCVDFHNERVSSLCYAWIVEQLNLIDNSKLVVTFDGNLSSISTKYSYIETIISILIGKLSVLNQSLVQQNNPSNNLDIEEKINLIKRNFQQYWSCFQ